MAFRPKKTFPKNICVILSGRTTFAQESTAGGLLRILGRMGRLGLFPS